jgi:hypothetical protein
VKCFGLKDLLGLCWGGSSATVLGLRQGYACLFRHAYVGPKAGPLVVSGFFWCFGVPYICGAVLYFFPFPRGLMLLALSRRRINFAIQKKKKFDYILVESFDQNWHIKKYIVRITFV